MVSTVSESAAKVELGSIVSQVKGTAMPSDLPEETRFVGLEDIASQNGQIIRISHISAVRSRVFQFQRGDVLYGRLRPYLKKAVVAEFDGTASGEIIVLRCSQRILPHYLLMLLLSEDFTHFVNSRVKGDRPRTTMATMGSYQFELPSLDAQEYMCSRYSRLENSVLKLEDAVERLNSSAVTLVDTMRTKLIWGENSSEQQVVLSKLVESIDYGTTQKSTYGEVGTPVLRIPNIASTGKIDGSQLKYAHLESKDIDKYRLKKDDILLIRSNGSLSLVGRAAKVGIEHEDYAFAGYLLRLRPRSEVLSDYLLEVFRSRTFLQQVEIAARSTSGINNLSAGRLAAFTMPLKPLASQEQIVDILIRLQRATALSTYNLEQALTRARTLREVLRGNWLGHFTRKVSEKLNNEMSDKNTKPDDYENSKDLEMDENIETTILRRLKAMPFRSASFETLFNGLKYDYDEMRDTVFKLLATSPPRLVQVFDKEKCLVVLRCPE